MESLTSTPLTSDLLRGHDHVVVTDRGLRPHRIPAWVGEQFPDPQLTSKEVQPSGVRIAVTTAARTIELVTHPTRLGYRGLERGRGSIDLVVDGEHIASDVLTGGDASETDLQTGRTTVVEGEPHTTRFAGLAEGDKRVELWLPHNEAVEIIGLRTDEPVAPAGASGRRWVHHGSSISQGSNAATPARAWTSLAARLGGVDLRNLGVGGSSLVDPFMARVIRDTPADLVSIKLGINVVNADAMRMRTFVPAVHGFLDTIREGHPGTPLLVVSPIHCGMHEHASGPITFDRDLLARGEVGFVLSDESGTQDQGRLTLASIREALAGIVEDRTDPSLHHLDGTALFGAADAAEHPLPDALHPGTAAHEIIGTRFAEHAFGAEGPFAPVS